MIKTYIYNISFLRDDVLLLLHTNTCICKGGDDDRCHIFTTRSSSERCFKLPAHPNTVFATSISIDGKLLAVGCSGEVLKIWNIMALTSWEVKEPSLMFTKEEVHDLGILCCAFLPDDDGSEKTLVTGGNDALIKVWRIQATITMLATSMLSTALLMAKTNAQPLT